MRITTRIVLGYGFLILMLIALVVYQIITINRLQSINRTLSQINFQNARTCLQLLKDRDLVEEYARKAFALQDPDYINQLKEYQKDFESTLEILRTGAVSDEERSEVKRLTQIWQAVAEDFKPLQDRFYRGGSSLPASLQSNLEGLRTQTNSVYQSNLRSMSLKGERSRKTGETAALVLLCSAFAALAVGMLISYLIFRSISKPLANLTEGTRAIADGKFFYRLDTTRNDEFAQLARDFNIMTQRLNELDQLKKDFVSHVSHELKAPLASMRETIQLMLEEIPGPLTEKQRKLLDLNLQSGRRLTSMIGNLLDASKMEAGVIEYELKRQDLIPLVQTAIAELDVQTKGKQIQIETMVPAEPLLVECDGDRIVQVVMNVVGNAVKFSPKGGIVQVNIQAMPEIPERLPERWSRLIPDQYGSGAYGFVTVADSGPGVADSEKEKIFEKFHQVKQEKKIAGQGVGLGLAICRTIIQAHRGAIWVEDNPGGGSIFCLLLCPGLNRDAASQASSRFDSTGGAI
jgi:signal transduction histidine kinase